jgi:CHAT domain-containing protein
VRDVEQVYDAQSDLTLRDLFSLSRTGELDFTSTKLLTLSACQVGRAQSGAADDFTGFLVGVSAAGCPNTVAAVWQVNDETTSQLMRRFYEMLGEQYLARQLSTDGAMDAKAEAAAISDAHQGIGAALRSAALWLRDCDFSGRPGAPGTYSHPYFWAAFQLYGVG